MGFPGGTGGKEPPCQHRRRRFSPRVGKIPWRRAWQPTPVFLPGESHGQRSLTGYSPWCWEESDMTEGLSTQKLLNSSVQQTLPTKVRLVKAMVFPVVMYGCESWTIKKATAAAAKSLQSCPTLYDPIDCSMPGLPVHHQLPEFTQTHVH